MPHENPESSQPDAPACPNGGAAGDAVATNCPKPQDAPCLLHERPEIAREGHTPACLFFEAVGRPEAADHRRHGMSKSQRAGSPHELRKRISGMSEPNPVGADAELSHMPIG